MIRCINCVHYDGTFNQGKCTIVLPPHARVAVTPAVLADDGCDLGRERNGPLVLRSSDA